MAYIKNIKEVTEPLKEQILKGDVHTIDDMRAWLKPLGYSNTINEAAISFVLRDFVMSKVPSGSLCNAEMIEEHLRPLLKHLPSSFFHLTSLRHSSVSARSLAVRASYKPAKRLIVTRY